ncbi:MAG: uncharacterized protein PWQ18_1616, partial [Clostridia bacterium]|nr:uncharacterized protein [Clostridia bacterium]
MPTLFSFTPQEILETIRMVQVENLDIRTITLGISLRDCATGSLAETCRRVYDKINRLADKLVPTGEEVAAQYGIPIVNKRIAVTPIAQVGEPSGEDNFTPLARALDRAATAVGVNFIGGFSALVHKGFTKGDRALFNSLPEALATTERVCASINVATTKAGMNMDAIAELGHLIKETARLTAGQSGLGCAKLVTFCNAPEDNP